MEEIKILAVDDEQHVLDVITQECCSYRIDTETAPLRAIERLKGKHFDIFIIDYRMPIINGIELFEEIKDIYKTKPYIGILSTAYGTTYLFELERSLGLFHFFVEKPFKENTLTEIIKKAINKLAHEAGAAINKNNIV